MNYYNQNQHSTIWVKMKGFEDHHKSNVQKTNRKSELKIKIINNALNLHSQGRILEAAECYKDFINKGFYDQRVFSNYGLILKDFGKSKEAEILMFIMWITNSFRLKLF